MGALVADALAEDELDPVELALVLIPDVVLPMLDELLEPELELPKVLLDVVDIVDVLLPEAIVDDGVDEVLLLEEAEVVLLPDVVEELPLVVVLPLALLELVTEATVLLDSMTNCGV